MLQIIVYVDPNQTDKQANIIQLLDQYYTVLVDAINGSNLSYFQKNFKTAHRLFFVSEFVSMCTVEELQNIAPDFAIVFNQDIEVSEKQWIQIERYLESLFFPSGTITGDIVLQAQKLLQSKQKVLPFKSSQPAPVIPQKEFYNLVLKEVNEKDCVLIQVDKPFCDLPYTVVIRDYSKKGLRSFFTDLFICSSWGVCRKDFVFLKEVWDHWKMEGVFDIDAMLLEATKRCFPNEGIEPEPEPEVYRRSIEEVLVQFDRREKGCAHDMKDPWNEERIRKRRREEEVLLN